VSVLDEQFGRWFERVELEPDEHRISSLRVAVDQVGEQIQPRTVLDLVAYACGAGSPSAFVVIQAALAEVDGFAAGAEDLEPRLVSAAALAGLLERGGAPGAAAAEGLLSAEFAGLDPAVEELPQLARHFLAHHFRELHHRPPLRAAAWEGPFARSARFLREQRSIGADGLVEEVAGALEALERFEARLDAAEEELDILWWALGAVDAEGRPRAFGGSSSELLLRTGVELADYHRFDVELPPLREIVRRVLGPLAAEIHTVADLVVAAAELVELPPCEHEALLPILASAGTYLAAKQSGQADVEDSRWLESFRRYGAKPSSGRRGEEIALQVVREILLTRLITR
jgi:hypothetical protein